MNVLVTGGAGFLGSALVDRILAEGHEVTAVDDLRTGALANLADARAVADGRLKIERCDVRDESFAAIVERRAPEVVFHLATETDRTDRVRLADAVAVDVAGTAAVLDVARTVGVRKVVAVGHVRTPAPGDLRRRARAMAADMVEQANDGGGLATTVLEMPTLFGPRQRHGRESSVVATFAERLVRGQPCVVHGDGTQRRDLLFVIDAVDALMRAAVRADGLRLQIGTGEPTSIERLHKAMAAIAGDESEVVPGAARAEEPGTVVADPERARMYLGWSAFTPLAEALTETLVALDPSRSEPA